jgi:hypothetical protein
MSANYKGRDPCRGLVLSAVVASLVLLNGTAAFGQISLAQGATTHRWVRQYGKVIGSAQYNVVPEDIQTTLGGYVAIGQGTTPGGYISTWLVKVDSSGAPLWQKDVGVPDLAPGDYSIGLSIQPTADQGYVIGGGTVGGGSGDDCPFISGIQCVWVTKVDSEGEPVWSRAYRAGRARSSIHQIRKASDGGYIGAGFAGDSTGYGALLMKLDSLGSVEWQTLVGPAGATNASFNAVSPTTDDGYVAAGEFYTPRSGPPYTSVLVVKFDASGNVQWQVGYNNFDELGNPTGAQHANSIIQAADNGHLIAGSWQNPVTPSGVNALLLRLDSIGSVLWQTALDGGAYNGARIGGIISSMAQTLDGGYALAGFGRQILRNFSLSLQGWLGKVDASGALLWQYFYYPFLARTGAPLGQHFTSVTLGDDVGFTAIGWSQIYELGRSDLYVVKTDENGLAGECAEVWNAPPLANVDPAMTAALILLPVETTVVTQGSGSPSTSVATSISALHDCTFP